MTSQTQQAPGAQQAQQAPGANQQKCKRRKCRGPLLGWASPDYQLAWARTEYYKQIIDMCFQDKAKELGQAIDRAQEALQNRILCCISYPKYDLAWAELNNLRNIFCCTAPMSCKPVNCTPKNSTPENSAPEEPAPKDSTAEESIPKDSTPKDSAPKDPSAENSTPKDAAVKGSTPKNSSPMKCAETKCADMKCLLCTLYEEIVYDLTTYPHSEEEKRDYRDKVEKLRSDFLQAIKEGTLKTKGIELRCRLASLSHAAALAAQNHWRNINEVRRRLFSMGAVIVPLVIFVICVAPKFLHPMEQECYESRPLFLLLLSVLGALGGLVSGIKISEPLGTKGGEIYLHNALLLLRPFVGASLALVVTLGYHSNLFSIANLNPDDPRALMVIAFASGFAERAFTRQLLRIVGG